MFKKLLADKSGIFYTAVIIIIVLFTTDIMYLVVAYSTNSFFDAWGSVTTPTIYETQMEAILRNVGPFVIVIINIGLIILLLVSAWKRGTNEAPEELLV